MIEAVVDMELERGREPRVGVGSALEGDAAEASVRSANARGAGRVELVRSADELVEGMTGGRLDACVRGTLPSHEVVPRLGDLLDGAPLLRVALLQSRAGNPFLLSPVGIDEGRDLEERWALLEGGVDLLRALGQVPTVAVLAAGRMEDADRDGRIAASLQDCMTLVHRTHALDVEADCLGVLVERAMEGYGLVVAPDGVTGNLVFRMLHYVGGFSTWGALAIGLLPRVYVDTSRDRTDFASAIALARWASATLGRS